MNEQQSNPILHENEDAYTLLTELHNSSECTQRDLSLKLDVSFGKVNYLLKELIKRGFISVKSFSIKPQKLKKVQYVLTKRGFHFRVDLAHHFFKKKEQDYYQMKKEWELLKNSKHTFDVDDRVEKK